MSDKHEQKKQDIIRTAFVEWSKDLYTNTNLTVIADAMGMTKPALFRYFPSKDDLYNEMLDTFMSDAGKVFDAIMSQAEDKDLPAALAAAVDIGLDFFITNSDKKYFTFFTSPLIKCQVTNRAEFIGYRTQASAVFAKLYGTYHGQSLSDDENEIIMSYIFYTAASIYMYRKKYVYNCMGQAMSGEALRDTKASIMQIVLGGFRGESECGMLSESDYEQIEAAVINSGYNVQRNKLFEAITAVIGRNGIAAASMDMIAKEMGFNSKSSLYAHFASRDEMLQELFDSESDLILDFIKTNGLKYDSFNKDLYGCIASTFYYFTRDINVLRYFDWLHYQMIRESIHPGHAKMIGVFAELSSSIEQKYGDLSNIAGDCSPILPIVLFSTFIIRLIVRKNEKNGGTTSPSEMRDLRMVFKMYLMGI